MLAAAPAGTVVITPTGSRAVLVEDYTNDKERAELKYEPGQVMKGLVSLKPMLLTKAS